MTTRHLSPNRNKKCWSLHIIHLLIAFLQTFPCFKQKTSHILSTISTPFHLMRHHVHRQINEWLNIGFRFWVDIHNYVYLYSHVVETDNLACCLICTTFMSTWRNQWSKYQVVSQMSIPWIMINFHPLSTPLVCSLLGISKP